MTDKIENEVTDDCLWCHQPGGDVVIDPYREDVYSEQVQVRLHPECYSLLCEEI